MKHCNLTCFRKVLEVKKKWNFFRLFVLAFLKFLELFVYKLGCFGCFSGSQIRIHLNTLIYKRYMRKIFPNPSENICRDNLLACVQL